MDDPWDVKSVRQSDQYLSCMKMNGVPILPPVLSKECRKEMQYYKLLALEVEKRIKQLSPLIDSDSDTEDKTDAPELPESENNYELPPENLYNKMLAAGKHYETLNHTSDIYRSLTSNVRVRTSDAAAIDTSKLVIDLSVSINETGLRGNRDVQPKLQCIDIPERDYNVEDEVLQKELAQDVARESINELNNVKRHYQKDRTDNYGKEVPSDLSNIPFNQDGPSSLSSKSFTGSLIDIHTESIREQSPKLVRQLSYTLLKPSPQLLAHLEVQSISTGIDMKSISMSESMSNIYTSNKKRKSWDLESAKVKWSSMAMELKDKNMNVKPKGITSAPNRVTRAPIKKQNTSPPARARSATAERKRRGSLPNKILPKSEPIQNAANVKSSPSNRTFVREPISPKGKPKPQPEHPISESEDPATKVRELYEKIQKQQMVQMANLIDKQKREQMLLQQVFEEQNSLLFKQLKTICPKSPVEAKEAWTEKPEDRGPVSLSQLINQKSPEQSSLNSPVSSTLTETKNYLHHCDDVLRKSRGITSNIKKQPISTNGSSPKSSHSEVIRPRTLSPVSRNASRRLNYDTSSTNEREYEPMLTDRTNDTMADLNVTFPSDSEDSHYNSTVHQNLQECNLGSDSMRKEPRANGARSSRKGVQTPRPAPTPQQITAACYSLHDTFITSTPAERCAMIAADRNRGRRRSLAARLPTPRQTRPTDIMSQSHSGAFPARPKRAPVSSMTQSNYETFSGARADSRRGPASPHRRPWR